MSKLKPDKISFYNDDFVVQIQDNSAKKKKNSQNEDLTPEEEAQQNILDSKQEAEQIIHNAEVKAEKILFEADEEKLAIIEDAKSEAAHILSSTQEELKKEAQNIIDNSKEEIEKTKTQSARDGYDEGYKDGLEKIREELSEKIQDFDNFCKNQYEVRDKILKNSSKDILNIIENITKKILLKEIDAISLDKIIKKTITLFEKKENITIILSEKYAKLLYELQKNSLNEEIELNFEDFKQYEGFDIVYNPKFSDDTIIVQNLKERFDASIISQLDKIIRDIKENSKNAQFELDAKENENEQENKNKQEQENETE